MKHRNAAVSLRAEEGQLAAWRAAADDSDHTTFSGWLRAAADRSAALPVRGRARADPELLRALARIGSNLNQLARAANRDPAVANRRGTLAELASLEEAVRALRHQC